MQPHKIVCAWCGKILREGIEPTSHGICVECKDKVLSSLPRHSPSAVRTAGDGRYPNKHQVSPSTRRDPVD